MDQQKFSSIAWKRNLNLYEKTLRMPFNEELRQGTLDNAKFRQYIIQDTKYLEDYALAFILAASKAKTPKQMAYLTQTAKDIVDQENSMHLQYFKEFGVSKEEYERLVFVWVLKRF